MALTEEEQAIVNRLRLRTGERIGPALSESETLFTDDEILLLYTDASSSLDAATLAIWIAKAAEYASMYDRSESGSTNSMSQLYRQAAAEVTRWSGIAQLSSPNVRIPIVGKAISYLRDECEDNILWVPVRNRAYTPGNWVTS